MSAALNTHTRADSSTQSGLTLQDLSLGSFGSISTPAKLRIPSASSGTTAASSAPLGTPSPPNAHITRRSRVDDAGTPLSKRLASFSKNVDEDYDEGGDVLDTPAREAKDELTTPAPNRLSAKRKSSNVNGAKGSSNLTLRDQEKHIDALKKENFNIKLKVHFLEERLAQLAPDQIDAALKQNINLKIEVQQRGLEMKKLKKLVLELEKELERLQKGRGRERDLEDRCEELEVENKELRRRSRGSGNEAEELGELRERNADLEDRQEQLEEELQEAQDMIRENIEEIERLKDELEHGAEPNQSSVGRHARELEAKVEILEAENEELRVKLDDHAELLTQHEDQREALLDEIDELRLQLERRAEAEVVERSQSRAQILGEREEREAIEGDYNALRDKLAANAIEINQKDDEIDVKNREIEELIDDHNRILSDVEERWAAQLEEERAKVRELYKDLTKQKNDAETLAEKVAEFESQNVEIRDRYEEIIAQADRDQEEKDIEIESANRDIQTLSERVYELEDEIEQIREESARLQEDNAVERDRLEALVAALKEKVTEYKQELQDTANRLDEAIEAHRVREDELAVHIEGLVSELRRERDDREKAEADLDSQARQHEAALRTEKRTLEAKESSLQSALNDLARTQALLTQRDADLADVQNALKAVEAESRKLGESHTTDRFSLQLEVDRLRRDVERLEEELKRARADLTAKETQARAREDAIDKLHGETRELSSQLSSQTQARLNLSEKLDSAQSSLRAAEAEVASYKQRVADLEQRLSKDQRSLLSAENQYRDQLTERNTLLLTIYQYLDKILGVDKTSKKPETKPFTNFSVFHDSLITRLKSLSQIQDNFEKRHKDLETKYTDKFSDLRKQLDNRWKQIDKFEASVKSLAEVKQSWKRKFAQKEGELDAVKSTNSELTTQLSSMKRPGQAESLEIKALQARATNAERRLTNAQNQLAATEEKVASMNQKTTIADNKWEARVKEYEARIKAAEERVKRERQGAKERVAELETNIKALQRQIDLAHKRNAQLNEVLETAKGSSPKP